MFHICIDDLDKVIELLQLPTVTPAYPGSPVGPLVLVFLKENILFS